MNVHVPDAPPLSRLSLWARALWGRPAPELAPEPRSISAMDRDALVEVFSDHLETLDALQLEDAQAARRQIAASISALGRVMVRAWGLIEGSVSAAEAAEVARLDSACRILGLASETWPRDTLHWASLSALDGQLELAGRLASRWSRHGIGAEIDALSREVLGTSDAPDALIAVLRRSTRAMSALVASLPAEQTRAA